MSRQVYNDVVFTCDGGCGRQVHAGLYPVGTKAPGEVTAYHQIMGTDDRTSPHWFTVTRDKNKPSKWRHYCHECFVRTGAYDEAMAAGYRDAVLLDIPLPEEAIDWWYDKINEFLGMPWKSSSLSERLNAIGRVMREFYIPAGPETYQYLHSVGRNRWAKGEAIARREATEETPKESITIGPVAGVGKSFEGIPTPLQLVVQYTFARRITSRG